MKKLIIIIFVLSSFNLSASNEEQVKQGALEFIKAELSGVHIDGKQKCVSKNDFQLNKIGPDIYAELDLSKIQLINFDTIKIENIKKIHKKFKRYSASFSVKSEDGKKTIKDSINFSINSKKNKDRYGYANLLKGTEKVLLRSDCK